ncbi:MAG: tetratricopeptide repeat protein [Chthoniobacterales bacterium]
MGKSDRRLRRRHQHDRGSRCRGPDRRGFAYRNLKEYDKALEDFDKVIEARPKDVEAYRRRVYVYRAMKQNEKAIADLKTILKLKPDDEDARTQLQALQKTKS